MFTLPPQLEKDTVAIGNLHLSRVLLMNNALFPWVILVPRVDAAREVIDLDDAGRHALMDEIALVSSAMQTLFTPDKLNIAALGNMVPQLHVHIIARFIRDTAWPNPVWGKGSEPYAEPQPVVLRLRETLRLTWKSD